MNLLSRLQPKLSYRDFPALNSQCQQFESELRAWYRSLYRYQQGAIDHTLRYRGMLLVIRILTLAKCPNALELETFMARAIPKKLIKALEEIDRDYIDPDTGLYSQQAKLDRLQRQIELMEEYGDYAESLL